MEFKHKHITVSGTFDHFHRGHKKIIDEAFSAAQKVSVGIAGENMLSHKTLRAQIESFEQRKKNVSTYVHEHYPKREVVFFELNDIYSISLSDSTLDSIVVTRETYKNAVQINKKRKEKKWPKLEIITVPFIKDTSGKILSSTRLREGEVNREGKVYVREIVNSTLHLPSDLRATLRQPLGKVIEGSEDEKEKVTAKVVELITELKPPYTITVGDVVSTLLLQHGLKIDLSIIDLHTQRGRENYENQGSEIVQAKRYINKPGTISAHVIKNTYRIIKKGLKDKKQAQLVIKGEEDLIALPAILLAPLGSVIAYGQMGLGVVVTVVTEELKAHVEAILAQFS